MQVAMNGYYSPDGETKLSNQTLGKDDFLKLLITELRYQDALEPMNDRDFIAQMAQMSALEQMQNLNKTVEEGLGSILEGQNLGQANMLALGELLVGLGSLKQGLDLLGREITYLYDGVEQKGTVTALKENNGHFLALIGEQEIELNQIKLIK